MGSKVKHTMLQSPTMQNQAKRTKISIASTADQKVEHPTPMFDPTDSAMDHEAQSATQLDPQAMVDVPIEQSLQNRSSLVMDPYTENPAQPHETRALNTVGESIPEGEFIKFKNLSPELRFNIWQLCFPRRTVHVKMSRYFDILDDHIPSCDCYYYNSEPLNCGLGRIPNCQDKRCHSRYRVRNELPITLHINQESRAETMKCYKVLFPGLTVRPIYFHPVLDTVSFRPYEENWAHLSAIAKLEAQNRNTNIHLIQKIRINVFLWNQYTKDYLNGKLEKFSLDPEYDVYPSHGGLRSFHGVKEINFSWVTYFDPRVPTDGYLLKRYVSTEEVQFLNALESYFARERKRHRTCTIPTINIDDRMLFPSFRSI